MPRRPLVLAAAAAAVTAAIVAIPGASVEGGLVGAATGATSTTATPTHQDGLGAQVQAVSLGDAAPTPPSSSKCHTEFESRCVGPQQLQTAYDVTHLLRAGTDGSGETIDVVDSFGSPTLRSDVKTFDAAYGLPKTRLRIDHPEGKPPAFNPNNSDVSGWALETTLDVDYAHTMAPGATIRVLETPVDETEGTHGLPSMLAAERWAMSHGDADVISQSFGATEATFSSPAKQIDALRGPFKLAKKDDVTVLGASGDDGATDLKQDQLHTYSHREQSWPSADPLVTSIGGLSLQLTSSGERRSPDKVWHDGYGAGGGGVSHVFGRPSWQDGVKSVVGSHRGAPDLSMLADVNGGGLIYTSFAGMPKGWQLIGGTSLATPLFAGVVALADQAAGHDLGLLNPAIYAIGAENAAGRTTDGLDDVTHGNNSYAGVHGYTARKGYDLASGWGTVDAARFVPALIKAVGATGSN